jgi:hypothetical protein
MALQQNQIEQLKKYISDSFLAGQNKEQIRTNLRTAGWEDIDIDLVFDDKNPKRSGKKYYFGMTGRTFLLFIAIVLFFMLGSFSTPNNYQIFNVISLIFSSIFLVVASYVVVKLLRSTLPNFSLLKTKKGLLYLLSQLLPSLISLFLIRVFGEIVSENFWIHVFPGDILGIGPIFVILIGNLLFSMMIVGILNRLWTVSLPEVRSTKWFWTMVLLENCLFYGFVVTASYLNIYI